ncbi:hypothetical protein A4X13_0g7303 [Tilletia indica]|uniref:Uncharacterized protein n=1 Tax=Tilletia indica TaxID=43049 RepID=A0A177T774_9BASI|nr:hypothetical protein A4X13_0g7303 [Tilletia indica]
MPLPESVGSTSDALSSSSSSGDEIVDAEMIDMSRVVTVPSRILPPRREITTMDQATGEIRGLRMAKYSLELDVTVVLARLERATKANKSLREANKVAADGNDPEATKIKELKEQIRDLTEANKTLRQSDKVAAGGIDPGAIKTLEAQIRDLDEECGRWREVAERADGAEEQLDEALRERESLRSHNQLLADTNARLSSRITELEGERDQIIVEVGQLQEQIGIAGLRSESHLESHGYRVLAEDSVPHLALTAGVGPPRRAASVNDEQDDDGLSSSPPERGSSPPWLLQDTCQEEYESARAYAKGLNVGKSGVDFFTEMRQSMQTVIAACGPQVEAGPFMALINQAGITKVDLVRLFGAAEDSAKEAKSAVVELEKRIDLLEVQLTAERGRGSDLSQELVELKAVLREKESRLAEQAADADQAGDASGSSRSKRANDEDEAMGGRWLERRRYGGVVVQRVISSPSGSGKSRK